MFTDKQLAAISVRSGELYRQAHEQQSDLGVLAATDLVALREWAESTAWREAAWQLLRDGVFPAVAPETGKMSPPALWLSKTEAGWLAKCRATGMSQKSRTANRGGAASQPPGAFPDDFAALLGDDK